MIRASIDIGSNSCLLLVLEVEGSFFKTLESHSRITSLGKNLDINKRFLKESIDATLNALSDYCEILSNYKINLSDVIVTATEASRVASNFNELAAPAKNNLGLKIQRISGEGEAYYTALGVARGVRGDSSLITIMDIGGASTELINVELKNFKILDSISLPVGSVRATDWLAEDRFKDKMLEIFKEFDLEKFSVNKLVCVAGTMTTLAALLSSMKKFDESKIHEQVFSKDDLKKILQKLKEKTSTEILEEFPICGKRSFSIYGGALVASEIAKHLNISQFEISTYGLRYGVALEGRVDERFI